MIIPARRDHIDVPLRQSFRRGRRPYCLPLQLIVTDERIKKQACHNEQTRCTLETNHIACILSHVTTQDCALQSDFWKVREMAMTYALARNIAGGPWSHMPASHAVLRLLRLRISPSAAVVGHASGGIRCGQPEKAVDWPDLTYQYRSQSPSSSHYTDDTSTYVRRRRMWTHIAPCSVRAVTDKGPFAKLATQTFFCCRWWWSCCCCCCRYCLILSTYKTDLISQFLLYVYGSVDGLARTTAKPNDMHVCTARCLLSWGKVLCLSHPDTCLMSLYISTKTYMAHVNACMSVNWPYRRCCRSVDVPEMNFSNIQHILVCAYWGLWKLL